MKIVLLQNIEAAIADDNTGELEEYLIEANEEIKEQKLSYLNKNDSWNLGKTTKKIWLLYRNL